MLLLGRLSLYGKGAERLHEEVVPVTARWVEPSQRKGPLKAYAREAETKTLELLEDSLSASGKAVPEVVQKKLLDAARGDIADLLPQLEPRAQEIAEIAIEKLAARGEREGQDLTATLDSQRKRVETSLARFDRNQLRLDLDHDHKRQLEADLKAWDIRLKQFDQDLEREPQRIRDFYVVKARRVEPIGLVYLWPETN